ncbi:hypothetical protein NDU88_001588 [Pleurodeles waltl]|uniref:Uncharacterized protein n=1 Tax=Pleurodeles waltl TaxID=8319 RepID=A0AAV7KPY1_PLEWA|nr:hypothetical protein NDU88_001588 [Pleurodeles waltl]
MTDAARKLLYVNKKHFEKEDKANRLLAYKLRQKQLKKHVFSIKDDDCNAHTSTSEILDLFTTFYSALYQAQLTPAVLETTLRGASPSSN